MYFPNVLNYFMALRAPCEGREDNPNTAPCAVTRLDLCPGQGLCVGAHLLHQDKCSASPWSCTDLQSETPPWTFVHIYIIYIYDLSDVERDSIGDFDQLWQIF